MLNVLSSVIGNLMFTKFLFGNFNEYYITTLQMTPLAGVREFLIPLKKKKVDSQSPLI